MNERAPGGVDDRAPGGVGDEEQESTTVVAAQTCAKARQRGATAKKSMRPVRDNKEGAGDVEKVPNGGNEWR
jgi:hypothetical protein